MHDSIDKFFKQINKSKNPLIVIPDSNNRDSTCAALALYNFFQTKEKDPRIIAAEKQDDILNFLKNYEKIDYDYLTLGDFMIVFDTTRQKIADVKYRLAEKKLEIFLSAQSNEPINPNNISFIPAENNFDLIIVLGASDLPSIGKIWKNHPNLFYNIGIANLDYHIENDQYGQINLVDIKASGISEILAYSFFYKQINIDQTIANCLYTGIMEATESFQTAKTTPKTLKIAAKLIDNQANHKMIVRRLYKEQDFLTIKFWGILMSRVRNKPKIRLSWTKATDQEIKKYHANDEKIKLVFNKIRKIYNKTETLLLLWQNQPNQTRGLIQNSNQEYFKELTNGEEWGKAIHFIINFELNKAEKKIIKLLEDELRT
ncbi:MAG: hypothetical protein GF332_00845 [Candidatus Moranbacteria bacterium]|nr:hypothetical protein [Candidatus Moranbacteria bacterium]